MSKKLLDLSVKDYLAKFAAKNIPSGDFGIETEIEGEALPEGDTTYWLGKPEGSLRGGFEYFNRQPVAIKALPQALEEYSGIIRNIKKPSPSIRCSTHIHVNVGNLTLREVYNVLGFYFLVEELLVRTQGPLRMGNLFCLRMSDAEGTSDGIQESIRTQMFFSYFNQNAYKYGAVNLAAVTKFGSLEFRFFRPLLDTNKLSGWCHILYNMVHGAKIVPLQKMLDILIESGPKQFLSLVWDLQQIEELTHQMPQWELQELLFTNFDHVAKIAYLLDNVKYEKFSQFNKKQDSDQLYSMGDWVEAGLM